jgi:pilus assembly protein Flp/PilA
MSLRSLIRRTLRHTGGTSAVEYGLICALIVLAMIGSLRLVAQDTVGMWGNINAKVTAAR